MVRRVNGSRPALSSVVAAAYLVMAITLGFNLMLIGATLAESTSQILMMRNLMTSQKESEQLAFIDTRISNNQLNITVFNSGGISINIVRLWISNNTASPPWHAKSDISYWIDPGEIYRGLGSNAGYFNASRTYTINLVSARGNVFQTIYTPTNTIVATVQGFGWVSIDWNSYQYTYSTGGGADIGPRSGWCVPSLSGTTYQFRLKAINHSTNNLTLISWTYLKFASNQGSDTPFFLMATTSTAQSPQPYSTPNIVLPANPSDLQTGGTPTLLKFLGKTPGGTQQATISAGDYSVLVVFFFQYTDGQGVKHTYGQTVPYEATEVVGSC